MDILLTILIMIVFTGVVSYFIYFVGKKKYPKISKYVPAIASAVGVACLYLKLELNLYTHAFTGIYDILGIILLSIIFGISIIAALAIELNNKIKSKI
ncbi:hypothetical protein [Sutcliffiella deserti]|uniref:hypothetical protein n=1 Tax=Sutcliffiella deserti TaxID=2875501 RepID=UPI001CBBCBE6|nr:hypothetical protein [Sutcliffiella deserti]